MAVISETDGIVLDSRDHGESDLIVTLYCRDTGRITTIAKGARRSKRRFVNKLEFFSFLQLQLRRSGNRSMPLLEEAELHSAFITLRQDITRYSAASVIRELLLLGTRDGEGDEDLYQLILWAFDRLDRRPEPLTTLTFFLLRYLDYIGYRPELDCCTQCGTFTSPAASFLFNTLSGGLVCSTCRKTPSGSHIPLSADTVSLLNVAQDAPLLEMDSSPDIKSVHESLNILHRYTRHILQREIHSWKMLRTIFTGTPDKSYQWETGEQQAGGERNYR